MESDKNILEKLLELEKRLMLLEEDVEGMPAYANPVRYHRKNPHAPERRGQLSTADPNEPWIMARTIGEEE